MSRLFYCLTLLRVPPGLRCHYCGKHFPVPAACAKCGHAVQRAHGIGTQQLEELVAARFPEARLARMDLTLLRRGGAIIGYWSGSRRGRWTGIR